MENEERNGQTKTDNEESKRQAQRLENTAKKRNDGTIDWRTGRSDKIAAILPRENMASLILRASISVPPGEAVLFIQKGKVVKIIEQDQAKISSKAIDRLKRWFGIHDDLVMMAMDTSQISMSIESGLDKYSLLAEDQGLLRRIALLSIPRGVTPKKYGYDPDAKDEELNDEKERVQKFAEAHKSLREDLDVAAHMRNEYVETLLEYGLKYEPPTPLLTKDRESVMLDVRLTLRLLPEHAPEVFKLLKDKQELYIGALKAIMQHELDVRVFAPRLCQYTGQELRINRNVIDTLETEAVEQLGAWLSNYGIQLIRLSINPAVTDAERMAVIEKEKAALEEAAQQQAQRNLLEAEREYDLLLLRQELATKLEQAKAVGDEEEQKLLRASLLSKQENTLSIAEIHQKIKQIKADTAHQIELKQKELEFLELDKKWELEKDKQTTLADIELRKREAETQADIERKNAFYTQIRETKKLKAELKIKEIETRAVTAQAERAHVKELIALGKEAGVLTGAVLTEAMRQDVVRKALDEGERATQAISHAEGQRYAKENFREGLSSQPQLGIGMQGQSKVWIQQVPARHQMLDAPQQAIEPANQAPQIQCPYCGKDIKVDSNFCGYCGKDLKASTE